MRTRIGLSLLAAVAAVGLGLPTAAQAQQANMTFFVTSVGKGNGADLGGLAGADAHCQALATAAGSTRTDWRAYLSTTAPGGDAGVNARDRIGNGPWQNAKGVVVAKSVAELHSDAANITKADGAHREGRAGQGPRRHAERARHPDRLGPAGHVLDRRRRHHLRQLDQERRRLGHRGSSRPRRPQGLRGT